MKSALLMTLVALALGLVQAVLWPWIFPFVAKPDLVLVLVVYLALTAAPMKGALAVFLIGSWFDTLAGSHPGLNAVVLLLVFWVVRYFSRRLNTESPILVLSMVLLATGLQSILVICFGVFAEAGPLLPLILPRLPLQLVLNLFVGLALVILSRFGLSMQIYVSRDEAVP